MDAALRRRTAVPGLVLAGAAGVGKTRLAREALTLAVKRGSLTRWVAATSAAQTMPLGAFIALLGDLRGDADPVMPRAIEALVDGSDDGGVVVAVDDAHLLDDFSALLVQQLVLRHFATVVVTVRTGEPAPDAVTALWKDEHLRRVEVQPLSREETTGLLAAVLGAPVDGNTAERIWALTRGNPLFLRHLVDGELEAGRIHDVGDLWRWSGDPKLGAGLIELVEARIGALPEPVAAVVDALALSEPLDVAILTRLADAEAVEVAETEGLVRIEHDAAERLAARLGHPLYGEVRRQRMGQLRARRLRAQIATALAADSPSRTENAFRVAVLSLDSDVAPDPKLLTAAAEAATTLGDHPLAERLARAAIAAGGGFESSLALAFALCFQDRGETTNREVAACIELASTDLQRVQAALALAGSQFYMCARPSEAIAALERAEKAISDAAARREVRALRAVFHFWLGHPQQAIEMATDVLASEALSPPGTVLATWALVAGLGVTGRSTDANRAAVRGYAAASTGYAMFRFGLSSLHIHVLYIAGRMHEAAAIAEERQVESDRGLFAQALVADLLGQAALARGHLRTSIRHLRATLDDHLMIGNGGGRDYWARVNLTKALAMTGDGAGARAALAEMEEHRHPGFVFLEPEVALASAWVAAAEGRHRQAIARAHHAAAIAAAQEQSAQEMVALHTAVRLGDRTVAERVTSLAAQLDNPRAPAAAAHAVGVAARDGDTLQAVSVQFEEMGDLLAAADAAAQAATAYANSGHPRSANVAAARAHRLAEDCEGARTPALVTAARPLPLTDREREIAILAAHGLSNREIAEQLVVSVRTVEGHLYRATSKFGMTNRHELARLLGTDEINTLASAERIQQLRQDRL